MLHHNHGIAGITQPLQRGDEPVVVPLVQSYAWLVQDVEHIHQPRTDLGCQPDALRLPAR